jgi:phage gp29-like protein
MKRARRKAIRLNADRAIETNASDKTGGVKKADTKRLLAPVNLPKTLVSSYGALDVNKIRRTIEIGSLKDKVTLFNAILKRDNRVCGDIGELRDRYLFLEAEIVGGGDSVREALQEILFNRLRFNDLLYDLSNAVAYGFSAFDIVWGLARVNERALFIPLELNFIEPSYFDNDKDGLFYKNTSNQKIYVSQDDPKYLLHLHKSASGSIESYGAINQVAWSVAAKHFALSQYLQYAELLGSPPIIVKTPLESEEAINALISQVLALRGSSVGVFGKDELVELFQGNANQEFFMRFISYIDSEISHSITGGFSANGTESGNRAKEHVADAKIGRATRKGAYFLEDTINKLLQTICAFNFEANKERPRFGFVFAEDIEPLNLQRLQWMGLTLSAADTRRRFGVAEPLDEADALIPVRSGEEEIGEEINAACLRDRRAGTPHRSVLRDKTNASLKERVIAWNAKKPQDEIEAIAESMDLTKEEAEIESAADRIFGSCQTYREALEALEAAYPDLSFDALEKRLTNHLANSVLLAKAESADKAKRKR